MNIIRFYKTYISVKTTCFTGRRGFGVRQQGQTQWQKRCKIKTSVFDI